MTAGRHRAASKPVRTPFTIAPAATRKHSAKEDSSKIAIGSGKPQSSMRPLVRPLLRRRVLGDHTIRFRPMVRGKLAQLCNGFGFRRCSGQQAGPPEAFGVH
jgi:hypothetical protein